MLWHGADLDDRIRRIDLRPVPNPLRHGLRRRLSIKSRIRSPAIGRLRHGIRGRSIHMSQDPSLPSPPPYDPAQSKRVVAGVLAILLGAFGAHRFYLGDTMGGIIRLLSSLVCVGGIIGL